MPNASVLFSLHEFPDHARPLDEEAGDVAGLAEWFDAVPALFLLLVGEGQRASSAIGNCDDAQVLLASSMKDARARWQRFRALTAALLPMEAHTEMDRIQDALDSSPHPWLVLDTIDLAWDSSNAEAFGAHLAQLQVHGASLVAALQPEGAPAPCTAVAELPEVLRPLVSDWRRQWGWWSDQVIARLWAVEYETEDERAPFLQALTVDDWRPDLAAYVVHPPNDANGGKKKRAEANRRPPVGLVTPYGRWLLPFEAGATSVYQGRASGPWVIALRDDTDKTKKKSALPSVAGGLMDRNGVWRYPVGNLGYADVVAEDLLWADFPAEPKAGGQLVRISTGEVLHAGVTSAFQSDDGLLRLRDAQERSAVASADGARILVPHRYEAVRNFDTRKRWAVMADSKGLEGVVALDGRELIPCKHGHIARGNRDAPPKVYGRNRFIGLDFAPMQLMLYDTDGRPVSAAMHFWTDTGNPIVEGDRLLTLNEDGPDAQVQWVDFDGQVLERTGMTRTEFYEARREGRSHNARRKKKSVDDTSLQAICDEAATGRGWLVDLIGCVWLGDKAASQAALQALLDQLRAAMAPEAGPDAVTALLWGVDNPREGLVYAVTGGSPLFTTFDWKDGDAVKSLALPVPGNAWDGFQWEPLDNGDDITEGLDAARKHLAPHGYALYELQSLGDYYAVGAVRTKDRSRFKKLVGQAALQLVI